MKLRVATYNIHKGVTGIRRVPRIHDVRLALHSIDADIVFLQEVQDRNDRLHYHVDYPKTNQLDFLATTGYEHQVYGKNAVYPHGHHGNAILSRHLIRHSTNHDISDHALEKRGMLHAVARVPGTGKARGADVHLICIHLGLIKRSRLRQADQLAEFVENEIPKKAPLIIAGDFNDWQRRVDHVLRARLHLQEAAVAQEPSRRSVLDRLLPWRDSRAAHPLARTFPSFAPMLTLDRIYVRGFRVARMQVPKGLTWARRSDHAPLIAELVLR
jgi:endonuclease/exonuclease/phosphatase family metal-dependent hydrolase